MTRLSRKIEVFLTAHHAAEAVRQEYLTRFALRVGSEQDLLDVFVKERQAAHACMPLGIRDACSPERITAEDRDEHIWKPILVAAYNGDREAAAVAWALGVRPAGYPPRYP